MCVSVCHFIHGSDQKLQDKANVDIYKSEDVNSTHCLFFPQIPDPPSSYLGLIHSLPSEIL